MLELGIKVKDKITGFTGTVTGKTEYLTGCRQYLVQPAQVKDGEYPQSVWLDEDRLEITGSKAIKLQVETPGPDRPAPRK